MKKFMTVLTVLFVFITMSFGQKNKVDGVSFYLNDGNTNTDLSVAHNQSETMFIVTFDYPVNVTGVNYNGVIEVTTLVEKSLINDGVYSLIFNYDDTYGGYVNGNVIIDFVDFNIPKFTESDTTIAYNNGRNLGFDEGVFSVVCDITQEDVDNAYNDGLTDADVYNVDVNDYQTGFEAGKSSCGTNGVSMTSFDMGVNVYPNPVFDGDNITVDCPFFESVTLLTITGQVVETYTTTSVPTSNLTSGMYFLNVKDTDGNVSATKVLVK